MMPQYGSKFPKKKKILREDSEIWICVILGQIGLNLHTCSKSDFFGNFKQVTGLPMEPLRDAKFQKFLRGNSEIWVFVIFGQSWFRIALCPK